MTVCASCGAWFTWPPPNAAALREHYAAGTAGMPGQLREWREETSQSRWYDVLAKRIARLATGPVRSIVDVGAGGLELSASLARQFPDARVEAWDLFADGMPARDRITLRQVDLNALHDEIATGTFDVVACVAVIEHVIDPVALFELLRKLTAPGGFAYIVGPRAGSLAHRLLRRSWPYYSPDDHITLPAMTSLRRLAADAPYELRAVNVYYSLKYLLRFLRVPLPVPRALDLALPLPTGAFEMVVRRAGVPPEADGRLARLRER